MDHAVVQRWLRQVLTGPYGVNADSVYAAVDRVLIAYSSLSPRTEVYTHDDGRSQLLLELAGTIPIEYKRATYHIPCSFWIPHGYPREPPIVYVTPTQTMLVRKGKHVDANGRVSGSYLDTWSRKAEGCNLLDLIHACQEIFSQQPPVYAKPAAGGPATSTAASGSSSPKPPSPAQRAPGPSTQQSVAQPQPPPPPLPPGVVGGGSVTASPRSSWGPAPPPLPTHPSIPQPSPATQHYGGSPIGTPSPALPPGPPRQDQYQSPAVSAGPPLPFNPASSPPPGPSPPPPAPPLPPMQSPGYQGHPPQHSQSFTPASHGPPLPPPAQAQQPGLPQQQQQPAQTVAPPPPRPLNPELLNLHTALHTRLTTTLSTLSSALSASNAQLEVLVSDLERGGEAIEDERGRLEAVRDVCRVRAQKVGEVVGRAQAVRAEIEEKERREREDVDGFVVATSLVGNQLLTLVAEDHALEDALYQLGRALNAERIDLDKFLKQTRHLAREQFMRRALARKINEGMRWQTE
ncbi:hypothetical protein V8E36_008055 [Tilletia maclaganii]